MTFTSALPANLVKFSLPLARFIHVSDTATTEEIATRADAVLLLTDSAIGTENRLSPLLFTAQDSAIGIEVIVERLISILDDSIGTESIIREAIISDSALGIDQSLPLAIALFLSDSAIGIEEAFLTLVEFLLTDSALGTENRLSPVPLLVSDSAIGIDFLAKKDMRFISDTSSGIEELLLELLASDTSTAFEALMLERIIQDSALGTENRLSPIPLLASDSAIGIDNAIPVLREVLALDTALGLDVIAVKNMRIPADSAIGIEVTLFERLLRDDAIASEIVSFISRLFTDSAIGTENRLSPLLFTAQDSAIGIDNAFFTLFETILTDTAVATDIIRSKAMINVDTAVSLEQAVISLHGVQLGTGIDRIIHRLLSRADSAIGTENRLSPVPLLVSDSAIGIEVIIHRLIELIEEGVTEESAIVKIFVPPFPQSISTTIDVASSYTSIYVMILMEMLRVSSIAVARAIVYAFRLLLQKISLSNILSTKPTISFLKIFYEYINLQHTLASSPIQFIPSILIQSIYAQHSSLLTQTISNRITLQSVASLLHSLSTSPTARIRRTRRQIVSTSIYTDTEVLHFFPVIVTTIGKIYTDILVQADPIDIITKSITDAVYVTLPSTIVLIREMMSESIVESIPYALHAITYPSLIVEKEVIDSVAHSLLTSTWDVHVPQALLTDVFIHSMHKDVFGVSYQSRVLTDVYIHTFGLAVHIGVFYRELLDGFFYGTLLKVRETTTAFRYLKQLQDFIINNFRYVSAGDPVLPPDHNLLVDSLQLFITFAEVLTNDIFSTDTEVRNKLEELRSAHAKLRYVKSFDIIVSRDHNRLIDTIIKAREFLRLLHDKVSAS